MCLDYRFRACVRAENSFTNCLLTTVDCCESFDFSRVNREAPASDEAAARGAGGRVVANLILI